MKKIKKTAVVLVNLVLSDSLIKERLRMKVSKERIDEAFGAIVGETAEYFCKRNFENDVDAPHFPLYAGLKDKYPALWENREICADYYDAEAIRRGSPRRAYRF